jgi:hypothetical protein
MAKKKSETSAKSTKASTSKEAGAKKPATEKKATRPAKPATVGMPMIDTSLAAQAAAAMLLNRRAAASEAKGSLIDQIKSDLNKPASAAVSGALNQSAPEGSKKPSNIPFGKKQVGHNQTYGGDLTRSGVPRRTAG